MNTILPRLLLVVSVCLLASCGDSHDKLIKDQMDYIDEMSKIIEKVADGKLSSADAVKKIEKWAKKGDEFVKRKEALNEDLSPEDLKKLMEKYSDRTQESMKRYLEAMAKLGKSGRSTDELRNAIINIKQ